MRRFVSAYKILFAVVVITVGIMGSGLLGQSGNDSSEGRYSNDTRMSSMGRTADRARHLAEMKPAIAGDAGNFVRELEPDMCVNEPRCPSGQREGALPGGQAEISIAVDITGQHVVIGFNDTRGFARNPLSVSGVSYSDDGGHTFVDGGQLPTPGNDTIGTDPARYPQIYGDPEVEYLGQCTFIYSSIMVKKFSATQLAQTMSVHRSFDCGHTWEGPFEVTSATNPHGPDDAADKEFMSVDPDTGRVLMSWSNFTPDALGGVEIRTTYSDNIIAAAPTWSASAIVAAALSDGQASDPAYAARSSNAYVVWRRYPYPGIFFGYGNTVGFARSTDNGQTWSAPVELSPEFFTMDQVLGNDRVNTSPSVAVDNSGGRHAGNVYVVYANNDFGDGADIVFQRSRNEGLTFSQPLRLNSRPGQDRAQWFPWVTVDQTTGRVDVFYYDQGIAQSGDLSEVQHTYSNDGGRRWAPPAPLTKRPFKAGWGNDTGQPNLGDYNQAVAQNGELFAAWAEATRPPLGFTDGQPSGSMTVPDIGFRRLALEDSGHNNHNDTHDEGGDHHGGQGNDPATLDLQQVTFVDSGGNGHLDKGETARFRFALRNYVTNPLNEKRMRKISARLSTQTAGVRITRSTSKYPDIDPGATATNQQDFVVLLLPTFVPGTAIEFRLDAQSDNADAAMLLHTQFTGTPVTTDVFAENFEGAVPGTLPAGWTAAHGGGARIVPWTTSNIFCGNTSNGAFHSNDNLASPSGRRSRFERLFSPLMDVPIDAEYITVEFDVCYDTEEDPNFNVLAYDGFLLRITDQTTGRTLRSVLVEAFADEFTTGSLFHYPRHFPRSGDTAYFQDMSAWAGYSNGLQRVKMRLPGTAGSKIQLRFEYTQDNVGTCADLRSGHACGVMVDNIVVKSVKSMP